MVVEDDATTEQSLIDCLSDLGNVITFSNAENALSFVERGGRLDLVISDIVLGQMNGIEFCERLNEKFSGDKFVPVMFYSAFADSSMERLAYQAGGIDFIEKPMSFVRLQLRVRAFLDVSSRFSSLRSRLDLDPMTGIMLLETFTKSAGIQLLKRMFTGSTSALILLNIRGTRMLNETKGAEAGDKVIIDVAQSLHEIADTSDLIVSRRFGDQFLILVPECGEGDVSVSCAELLEKLRAKLEPLCADSAMPEFYGGGATLKHTEDLRTDRVGSANAVKKMIKLAQEQMIKAKDDQQVGWKFVELTHETVSNG
jgi:PleD family two-component response regulator